MVSKDDILKGRVVKTVRDNDGGVVARQGEATVKADVGGVPTGVSGAAPAVPAPAAPGTGAVAGGTTGGAAVRPVGKEGLKVNVVRDGGLSDGLAPLKGARAVTPGPLTYADMFRAMSPDRPQTPQEQEAERKKRRRQAIFSAIGDGISALSNLWFTTQYAPNAYDATKGMSAKTLERFERMRKEREDKDRNYMSGLMRAMEMDRARGDADRQYNLNVQLAKERGKAHEAQARRDAVRFGWEVQDRPHDQARKRGDAEYATERGREQRVKADYAGRRQEAEIKRKLSGGGGGGGSKATDTWKAYNPKTGEEMTIHASSKANAWSKCPQGYIIRQESTQRVVEKEVKSASGKTQKNETVKTTVNGGEVDKKVNGGDEDKNKSNVNWK